MKLKQHFAQVFLLTLFVIVLNGKGFAQILDSFDDGDFTNAPTWTGDDTLFKISTYSSSTWSVKPRLQLNATQAGVAHLRFQTPISNIDSTEWRFWIRLSLSSGTSTTNNARVYLTSDSANLLGPLNGYFVMFGDDASSSKDNISLWRQNGSGVTQIINGTIGNINASKNISIKVLRDNSGKWKLYSDTIGGINYQLEGIATDTTFKTSQYMGVSCKYTSSNKTNYYFDDFYVGSIVKDVVSPSVIRATVTSDTQLELQFSESLDTSAIHPNFYVVNNGLGTPLFAELDGINPSIIRLTFGAQFQQNVAYQLTVSGVTDLVGNVIVPQNVPFAYYVAKPWDVVVNEIMADPDPVVGLPNVEYVELKNNTSLPINLNGWFLVLGTSSKMLPDYILAPDSFVIVTAAASAGDFGVNVPVIGVSSFSVTNSGQEIYLYTPTQMLIDYVNFSDSWYADNFKINGGWSLEQIDPLNYCGESLNWKASTDLSGGTPGRRNSVNATNHDDVNPIILRAVVQTNYSVMLFFSESMNSATLSNTNRYSASANLGHPAYAVPSIPANKSVLLTFADSIIQGQTYTVSVTDTLTDCSGNTLLLNSSAQFAIAFPPQPNDVVINEILSNPREGGVDFVELYNRSTKIVELKQLLLGTMSNGVPAMKVITDEGYLLFPGEYVVLSTSNQTVRAEYSTKTVTNFVEMVSFPTYNNDDGVVMLTDLNSTEIDKVAYDVSMHYALLKSTDGVSLERISPERLSTDKTNWHSAASTVGYATPGYQNSQWSDATTSDNEITITPEVFTPDNDGMDDVGNINYTFSESGYRINIWIYNSSGFKVKQLVNNDLAAMEGTYSWDGTSEDNKKASTGIYVCYIEVWKLDGTVKRYKKPMTLGARYK